MRVALDVTPAARQTAGVGRYTRELMRALLARGAADYTLVVADRLTDEAWQRLDLGADVGGSDSGRSVVRSSPLPARAHTVLWHRLRLPLPAELLSGAVDVYHSADFLAPPLARARGVVTVHDLSFLRVPDRAEPRLRRHLASAVPRAVRRAAHVLADSENTRRDVIDLLSVPTEQVSVAYPGVGAGMSAPLADAARSAVLDRLELDKPFVLGVGTIEPRKDWPTLIGAFERLVSGAAGGEPAGRAQPRQVAAGEGPTGGGPPRRAAARGAPEHAGKTLRSLGPGDLTLVIAGGDGWMTERVHSAAQESPADVRLLGFVPDDDLRALYQSATAFAYPSVYEGFGLPPLEAMACGVPTVVSDAPCLPEVVGDAALVAPVGDADALAEALRRLLTEDGLRRELQDKGKARAARYTWDACAEAAERAYRAAMSA